MARRKHTITQEQRITAFHMILAGETQQLTASQAGIAGSTVHTLRTYARGKQDEIMEPGHHCRAEWLAARLEQEYKEAWNGGHWNG